jgi:hypothetical protein
LTRSRAGLRRNHAQAKKHIFHADALFGWKPVTSGRSENLIERSAKPLQIAFQRREAASEGEWRWERDAPILLGLALKPYGF